MKVCGHVAMLSRQELASAKAGIKSPIESTEAKLVRIPRPSQDLVDQLTDRALMEAARSGPADILEDETLCWLADVQARAADQPGGGKHSVLAREIFGDMQENMRRPTEAEISAMAGRIAHARLMTFAQEQEVRSMLRDIADTLFGPEAKPTGTVQLPPSAVSLSPLPAYTSTPSSSMSPALRPNLAKRPTQEELHMLAASVVQSRPGQEADAHAALQLMTDLLFGTQPGAVVAGGLAACVVMPTPRTLDAITRRVVQRTGSSEREDNVRQMLTSLMQQLFGPSAPVPSSSSNELHTARSSVRSRSNASDHFADYTEVVNQEVQSVLFELCLALFHPDTP